MSSITIAYRFRGPETSGNGGYTAGSVARFLGGDAEVTLRRPPPLGKPLRVTLEADRALVYDDALVAEGVPATLELAVPDPPTPAEALAASLTYAGLKRHFFPHCFVCGRDRAPGDGLRIFPGWVPGRDLVAAPAQADASLPAEDGALAVEIAWSFLDCAGAWAVERDQEATPVVLGRMTARLLRPIPIGTACVVVGWPLGREGRKLHSGTAVFGPGGALHGYARQTWIVLA